MSLFRTLGWGIKTMRRTLMGAMMMMTRIIGLWQNYKIKSARNLNGGEIVVVGVLQLLAAMLVNLSSERTRRSRTRRRKERPLRPPPPPR